MNRCDVCGEEKEEFETHNYQGGLTRCKKHSIGFALHENDGVDKQ